MMVIGNRPRPTVVAESTIFITNIIRLKVDQYTVKIWSKKGDRSVKRVKSYSKWSKLVLEVVIFHSISSKILQFLQSDPLFTPYGVIIFHSVDILDNLYLFTFFSDCRMKSLMKISSPVLGQEHNKLYIEQTRTWSKSRPTGQLP